MAETIHEKRIGAYVAAFTAANGKPPQVAYYASGFYYIAGNPGVAPQPYRGSRVEEITANLLRRASPEGQLRAALTDNGFRPTPENDRFRLEGSAALAIATNAAGTGQPAPDDWALTVWRKASADEAETDIQHNDQDAPTFAEAVRICAEEVATISKAARIQDAAAKLAAEYDSECQPDRAGELRRGFAELPEASAARLYDILARHF